MENKIKIKFKKNQTKKLKKIQKKNPWKVFENKKNAFALFTKKKEKKNSKKKSNKKVQKKIHQKNQKKNWKNNNQHKVQKKLKK